MIGKLFRGLTAFIAYVCTATVITLLAGLAYLWHTDRLNDEKIFRMVALFHDVDLHQIAESQREKEDQVPPEEVALEESLRRQQVMDRNYEVKLLALRKGRQEYDLRLRELNEKIDRYDRMAQDWQSKLAEQKKLTSQENLTTVVNHLAAIQPQQAKDELLLWMNDGREDEVILLLNSMPESKRNKILKKFLTDEERSKLYAIHQRIIDSGGEAGGLKEAISNLNNNPQPNQD